MKTSVGQLKISAVVDPGFPVGGRGPVRGGVDLRHGCLLVKMNAKTKELGPIGRGVCTRHSPLGPPMISMLSHPSKILLKHKFK